MIILSKNPSPNNRRYLFFNRNLKPFHSFYNWREIQQRALQFCGRGGKGHLRHANEHAWNRKGRW